MKIRVLAFAGLAERLGWREREITVADGACAGDALNALAAAHAPIAEARASLALAVNEAYAPPSRRLAEGDTLALIPPVSGG
ncbi:MAG: molybdopterin converting factor subunit 1 [Phycisphaerales bacterium]